MNPSHANQEENRVNKLYIKSGLITVFKELESLCIAMGCMEACGKKFKAAFALYLQALIAQEKKNIPKQFSVW